LRCRHDDGAGGRPVKVDGVPLAVLDVPAERTADFNRWYDLDHLPEHQFKGDTLQARRYVAPRALRTSAGVEVPEFGYGPYLTTYLHGGPIDLVSDEAAGLWRDKDRSLVRQGRYWTEGRPVHSSHWRLERSLARPSCLVSEDAIPYLAHRGVVVALGRAPSGNRRQEAVDWWERTHLVDLFGVRGVLAALRFGSTSDERSDQLLHLLLCEEPVADVLPRIQAMKRFSGSIGRYPAYGGGYESTAFLPYDRIVPLDYDFEV
jgi:hypothetical protein